MSRRGERELNNLEFIRNKVFNTNVSEISAEEFADDSILYVNINYHKYCYGMTETDCKLLENILFSVKPNPNLSEFPDFFCDNGFVEHFEITASPNGRKGSKRRIDYSEFDKTIDKELESFINKDDGIEMLHVKSKTWAYPKIFYSYENLKTSFINRWKGHIDSLEKYSGSKEVGIFLVELPENSIASTKMSPAFADTACCGDLLVDDDSKSYRLSRDKELLRFIFDYREKINYVILRNLEYFEIISVEQIPLIIKLLQFPYCFYPLDCLEARGVYQITCPKEIKKSENIK